MKQAIQTMAKGMLLTLGLFALLLSPKMAEAHGNHGWRGHTHYGIHKHKRRHFRKLMGKARAMTLQGMRLKRQGHRLIRRGRLMLRGGWWSRRYGWLLIRRGKSRIAKGQRLISRARRLRRRAW